VVAFVLGPDVAPVVVSEVGATEVAAVVDSDVAVVTVGSGLKTRGWGVCRDATARTGSECRRFRGAGDSFEGRGKFVVVVVNNVDGGCTGVVSGDVAVLGKVLGGSTAIWVAVSVVLGVTWALKSTVVVLVGSPHGSVVCFFLHSSRPSLIPPR
jgi:hypothetical protein